MNQIEEDGHVDDLKETESDPELANIDPEAAQDDESEPVESEWEAVGVDDDGLDGPGPSMHNMTMRIRKAATRENAGKRKSFEGDASNQSSTDTYIEQIRKKGRSTGKGRHNRGKGRGRGHLAKDKR